MLPEKNLRVLQDQDRLAHSLHNPETSVAPPFAVFKGLDARDLTGNVHPSQHSRRILLNMVRCLDDCTAATAADTCTSSPRAATTSARCWGLQPGGICLSR